MGNTNSMNNLSLVEQKRYSTEFLRYSQIPYESHHHQHQQQQQQQQQHHPSMNPNMSYHQYKYNKERGEQNGMPNPVKVLPDVKFEPKLRTTNNGAILQSGGTISGRKESDVSFNTFIFD